MFSGAFEELATHLLDSVDILTKNWNILDNVLETLDIQQHSLGVLYVLIAKFNSIAVSVLCGIHLLFGIILYCYKYFIADLFVCIFLLELQC